MGNTNLIFGVCLLSVVLNVLGLYTGEKYILMAGNGVQTVFALALISAYLCLMSYANDMLDDIAMNANTVRVFKAKLAADRPSTLAEMGVFTASGFLCLFTGYMLAPSLTMLTLVWFWLAISRVKRAVRHHEHVMSTCNQRAPERPKGFGPAVTAAMAAASGAAPLSTHAKAQDSKTKDTSVNDPWHPLNSTNIMQQAVIAESVRDHATTSQCIDTSSNYSSSDSCSSSYSSSSSSSDSGSSSSW